MAATDFSQLTQEQAQQWATADLPQIGIDPSPGTRLEIHLENAQNVTQDSLLLAIKHVAQTVPIKEIEEIWFNECSLLIVKPFDKPAFPMVFEFERQGFGDIVIDAR